LGNAEAFAQALSDAGLCIVSGLAAGIDAAAHRGALRGRSSSLAVCGTGLDRVYPARNRELARQLSEQGALVSEFPIGTPPAPSNFPRRNRIISGLSLGCLVVEANLQSGSLITARQALEQGRDVFAIPGSIHSPLSKGSHWLIKQGAKLVEAARDVLDELGWSDRGDTSGGPVAAPFAAEHGRLVAAMGYEPVDLESICEASGLTPDVASAMLLSLELDGTISRMPGGLYQRLR
jgi:DNA processing protein